METLAKKNSQFYFPPLASTDASIRVLRIHGGKADEALSCSLQVVDLGQGGIDFAALSYTWDLDQSSTTKLIHINGHPFHVFANLHEFLYQLRSRDYHQDVWADAICINQADVEEKNSQVALMGRIYSSANRVFAWLGGDHDGSSELIDRLNTLMALFGNSFSRMNALPQSGLRTPVSYFNSFGNTLDQHLGQTDSNGGTPSAFDGFWHTYLCLLERSHWYRTWIVQEILLARNEILFFCGTRILTWSTLSAPADYAMLAAREKDLQAYHSTTFSKFRRTKLESRSQSLETLLREYGHLSCVDVRDKIYACLGLLHGQHARPNLLPDYSITPTELFCRLVTALPPDEHRVPTSKLYHGALRLGSHIAHPDQAGLQNSIGSTTAADIQWALQVPLQFLLSVDGGTAECPKFPGYFFAAAGLSELLRPAYVLLRELRREDDPYSLNTAMLRRAGLAPGAVPCVYHPSWHEVPSHPQPVLYIGHDMRNPSRLQIPVVLSSSRVWMNGEGQLVLTLRRKSFLHILSVYEDLERPFSIVRRLENHDYLKYVQQILFQQ